MSKNPKIITGILSHKMGHERREAIRRTWMHKADHPCYFLVGDQGKPSRIDGDIMYLDCGDYYENLTAKVMAFFRYSLNYLDFDFLFKCDDDTYVFWDLLMPCLCNADYIGKFTQPKDCTRTYHFGKCHDPAYHVIHPPFTTPVAYGGTGYFLSRNAVEAIVKCKNNSPMDNYLYEDSAVAHTLALLEARGFNTFTRHAISSHYSKHPISAKDMLKLYRKAHPLIL